MYLSIYSYHCDANGHYSLIDYFVCSTTVIHNVDFKSSILVDGDNTSDHYAISLIANVSASAGFSMCMRTTL